MMRDHMISNSLKQQLDCKFYCLIHSLRMEIRSYKAKRGKKILTDCASSWAVKGLLGRYVWF